MFDSDPWTFPEAFEHVVILEGHEYAVHRDIAEEEYE
jgi:hypothetical protein